MPGCMKWCSGFVRHCLFPWMIIYSAYRVPQEKKLRKAPELYPDHSRAATCGYTCLIQSYLNDGILFYDHHCLIQSHLNVGLLFYRHQYQTIIQVYAPTSDYDMKVVEQFYESLEKEIKRTHKKDITIVQGDWNAKIGPEAFNAWAGTVGRFGIGETNERGLRLLQFAKAHKLTIANTLHPHKTSRTATWHSPDGKTHNQIDFILTPLRFKSSINKAQTRTFPGADIGSDHDFLLASFKLKLLARRKEKSTRIRFDLDKLKDPNIAEAFQATVGGKFAALNIIDQDVNTLSSNINDILTSSAEEVLGRQQKKRQPWVTNEIIGLCDKRRKLKNQKHTSDETRREYQKANAEVRKALRLAKEKWIYLQCLYIEQGVQSGNSKKAYNTLKILTKPRKPKTTAIEDKEGNILTNEESIAQRWTEYCSSLYNAAINTNTAILQTNNKENLNTPPILEDEVTAAIKSLKPNKSPGVDNVPSELLCHGGKETAHAMRVLCQKVIESKTWPKEWTQSLVIPIPKKGNLKQCNNYRTISLISHPSKILLRILLNRLMKRTEEILSEEQAGFRAKRSTVEQVFNIRILTEKFLQHQRHLFHNFIDFKKAFDRVWHEGLWHVLRKYDFEEGLIQTLESLYETSTSAVLSNNKIGEYFRTSVGVRQGCILSPTLFNIFLENIMEDALEDFNPSVSIGGRKICNLRFADDIDLMAETAEELQILTDRLSDAASKYGMQISTEKSKIMGNGNTNPDITIHIEGEQLEEVDTFKYLGVTLTKDGSSKTEIKRRMAAATAAMSGLTKIWKSNISISVKIKLYKSLVLSIFLYGCEAWTLLADSERRIQAFENKCYRKILRVSYTEHRTNVDVKEEIEALSGPQEPLLACVKRRKLTWFGHVTRHDGLSKTILQGTVEGQRKRGRQRKMWVDNIKQWTGLSLPQLLEHAMDRAAWRRTASSASRTSPRRPSGHGTE